MERVFRDWDMVDVAAVTLRHIGPEFLSTFNTEGLSGLNCWLAPHQFNSQPGKTGGFYWHFVSNQFVLPQKFFQLTNKIPKVYERCHLTMSWMTILTRVSGAECVVL